MNRIQKAAQIISAAEKIAKQAKKNNSRRPYNPNSTGAKIGARIGKTFHKQNLGRKTGDLISRVVGHGDYSVSNSLVMGGEHTTMIPEFTPDGRRGLRVREREFLGDIYSGALSNGSSIFTNQSFAINPGLVTVFPWLSAIANQFDQWVPNGIIFEFRSTSSTFNGSSQALGTVILATEYDVADPAYGSKVEMENSDFAVSTKASDSAIHGCECSPKERIRNIYNVRSGAVPSNDIERNYDLGIFQLATQGMSTANVNVGELWVSYDITFYKKQVFSAFGNEIRQASYNGQTGVGNNTYLGPTPIILSNMALTLVNSTSNLQVTFPSISDPPYGDYLVTFAAVTSSTATSYTCSLGTLFNCFALNNPMPVNTFFANTPVASVANVLIFAIRVTGPNAFFNLTGIPFGAAVGSRSSLTITELNPTLDQ